MYSNQTRLISTVLSIWVFGLLMIGIGTKALAVGDSELNQQLSQLRPSAAIWAF